MRKVFIDTEFIEDGRTIDLISIGLVSGDGREYYAQSVEYDETRADRWVKEHVFPHLLHCKHGIRWHHIMTGACDGNCPWRTREQLRREVQAFIGAEPFELWAWCGSYDHVALCQLFGKMVDAPAHFPHHIKDLQFVLDARGITDDELPEQEEGLHNALADAKHIQRLWKKVTVEGQLTWDIPLLLKPPTE